MGQKIHPHGLRLGTYRKWNNTWFGVSDENKNLFFHQKKAENFLKSILHFYDYTKISQTKKALIVDLKLFKYGNNHLFVFVFFYKFKNKKRKESAINIKSTPTKYQWFN